MNKIFNNPAGFAIYYVLCALPTYIIPWIKPGVMSLAAENVNGGTHYHTMATVWTVIQGVFLLGLAYGAYARGKYQGKTFMTAFPVVALLFDLVPLLSFIPFVPSVMHACCFFFGMKEEKASVQVQPASPMHKAS